jgi:O-acetyl-ADP-ribose deacetylase (regulator of RNase III)
MKPRIVNGNLLDSTARIIAHQTNCNGGFGSGVAKAIKEKWPYVAERYFKNVNLNQELCNKPSDLLGTVQLVKVDNRTAPINEAKFVANLYAQENFGYDGKKYTSYDALDTCFGKLVTFCNEHDIKSIAFPYGMSSVRGGANWDVVMALINAHFADTDIDVEIRKLDLA